MSIDQVFGTTGDTDWLQVCARALAIFAYGLLVLRVAGRRLFANWSALDIVVAIVTGSTLSRALTGNADLFGAIAAVTLLIALHWALARACAKWQGLSRALEGKPVVLAEDGVLEQRKLLRHAVSRTNLEEALHAAGLVDPAQARRIVLQPNGKIAVFKR